ncbi:MAG: hypothetical protein QM733_13035 [Ilumatobacteraceae bacterium]
MPEAADNPVDRWFVERGVPHLIAGYRARTGIWRRAWLVLLIAYLAGGFLALDTRHWSVGRNLLATVVILAVLAAVVIVTNAVARRPLLAVPRSIGAPELAGFVIGPALPSLIFEQWDDALYAILEGLGVLAVIYVVTSYGLIPLAMWAARRAARSSARSAGSSPAACRCCCCSRCSCSSTPTCGRWPPRSKASGSSPR